MIISYQQSLAALGLRAGYTSEDLNRAYRKAAHRHHPDKGGDAEKFKEVAAAYNFLKKYPIGLMRPGIKIHFYSTYGGFSINL